MTRHTIFLLAPMILTLGCIGGEGDGFVSGGSSNQVADDTADTGDENVDTGSNSDCPGWEEPQDDNGPSLDAPTCTREDYPNIGWNVVCQIPWCEGQSSLVGGILYLQVEGEAFGNDPVDVEAPIAAYDSASCEACLYDEYLQFALEVGDDDPDYDFELFAQDSGENKSNILVFTAEGI